MRPAAPAESVDVAPAAAALPTPPAAQADIESLEQDGAPSEQPDAAVTRPEVSSVVPVSTPAPEELVQATPAVAGERVPSEDVIEAPATATIVAPLEETATDPVAEVAAPVAVEPEAQPAVAVSVVEAAAPAIEATSSPLATVAEAEPAPAMPGELTAPTAGAPEAQPVVAATDIGAPAVEAAATPPSPDSESEPAAADTTAVETSAATRAMELELLAESRRAIAEQAIAPRSVEAVRFERNPTAARRMDTVSPLILAIDAVLSNRNERAEFPPADVAANLLAMDARPNVTYMTAEARVAFQNVNLNLKVLHEDWSKPETHIPGNEERTSYAGLLPRGTVGPTDKESLAIYSAEWANGCSRIIDKAARKVWAIAQRAGFAGGSVFLPAQSASTFARWRPNDVPARMTLLPGSPLYTEVARRLHPEDQVIRGRLKDTVLPADHFDVAFVHMGTQFVDHGLTVSDRQVDRNPAAPLLHERDLPLAKALIQVRPGGVVFAIMPSTVIDKAEFAAFMTRMAEPVFGVPVPAIAVTGELMNGEAGQLGMTNPDMNSFLVVALQRRLAPLSETAAIERSQEFRRDMRQLTEEVSRVVERGFRPGITLPDGRYLTGVERTIVEAWEFATMQADLQLVQPAVVERPIEPIPEAVFRVMTPPSIDPNSYDGSFVLGGENNDQIFVRNGNQLAAPDISVDDREVVRSMMPVREALREVLRQQMTSNDDAELAIKQRELNQAYDRFVQRHGPFNLPEIKDILRPEPAMPQLLALEEYDPDSRIAEKSEFFTARVIGIPRLVERVEESREALALTMGRCGHVSPAMMEHLTGRPWERLMDELHGEIFVDPQLGRYVTSAQYLSGNVREKLAVAENAALVDPPRFNANVNALRAVQPQPVPIQDIDIVLGAPWIPDADISRFALELMQGNQAIEESQVANGKGRLVTYDPIKGKWIASLLLKRGDLYGIQEAPSLQWSTQLLAFRDILVDTLNNKSIRVLRPFPDDPKKRYMDHVETAQAQMLQARLKDEFARWVVAEPNRAMRFQNLYNDAVNAFRERAYDGNYLQFAGKTHGRSFRGHQINTIARVVEDGNALVAHPTGSGKGSIIVGAVMELRAMGLAKKPLIAVPKATVTQIAAEFIKFYPAARVLVGQGISDRNNEAVQSFISKAMMDDWDAVLVTHETLKALPLSPRARLELLDQEIIQTRRNYARWGSLAGAEKIIDDLKEQRDELNNLVVLANQQTTGQLYFDQVGFDRLLVDEFHMFKNADIRTSMNVLGLNTDGSDRALDMQQKISFIRKATEGRGGIVALTATPICNSIAEIYVMMDYVNPQVLASANIAHFDGWAQTFGQIVSNLEQKAAGDGFVIRDRFASFQNVPEMTRMFRMLADIKTDEDIPEMVATRPAMTTELLISPRDEFDRAFLKGLEVRSRSMTDKDPIWAKDSPIVMMGDLSRGMLDLRIANPAFPENEESSIRQVVDKVMHFYEAERAQRGVQLLFCDQGMGGKADDFSVYRDIRDKLVARGIPAREIAFINEHDKPGAIERFRARVNAGLIRVAFGSTTKMGVGTNIQERVCAMYQIDLPLRPDMLEQRIGRGRRSGNRYRHVHNFVAAKEGQTRRLEILQAKSAAIRLAMSNPDKAARRLEEEISVDLEHMQSELTDNPLLREKVVLEGDLRRLDLLRRAHSRNVAIMTVEATKAEAERNELAANADSIMADGLLARTFITNFQAAQDARRDWNLASARRDSALERARRRDEAAKVAFSKLAPASAPSAPGDLAENEAITAELLALQPELEPQFEENVENQTDLIDEAAQAPGPAVTELDADPSAEQAADTAEPNLEVTALAAASDDAIPELPPAPRTFVVTIDDREYEDPSIAGNELRYRTFNIPRDQLPERIGTFGPFDLVVKFRRLSFEEYLDDIGRDVRRLTPDMQMQAEVIFRQFNRERRVLVLRGSVDHEIDHTLQGRDLSLGLLKAVRDINAEADGLQAKLNRLDERYRAATAEANQSFPEEDRWNAMCVRKAEVDSQLLAMVAAGDANAEARTLAPLHGMRFRNGRPMHPTELKDWSLEQDRLALVQGEANLPAPAAALEPEAPGYAD